MIACLRSGRFPALEEIVEAGEALLQRRLGEIAQDLGDELAVLVEILDALGDDAGADAVDVDLRGSRHRAADGSPADRPRFRPRPAYGRRAASSPRSPAHRRAG